MWQCEVHQKSCQTLLQSICTTQTMFHWLVQSENVVRCFDVIPDEERKDWGYLVMEKYDLTLEQLLKEKKDDLIDWQNQPTAWFRKVSLPHLLSCTFWHKSLQKAAQSTAHMLRDLDI